MDEFLLLLRSRYHPGRGMSLAGQPPQLPRWQQWIDQLTAAGSLGALPTCLDETGRILTKDQPVAEGLYVEGEEAIDGLLLIKAADYEAATQLAQGCPILAVGGTVEVRRAL